MLSSYILRMAEAGRQTAFLEQGVYRSRSYSYAHVQERSLAFCHMLGERGLAITGEAKTGEAEGPRVLLWATPGASWAMAFYGCLLAGAVVVPVDAGFSADFVARVGLETGAALLVSESKLAERLGSLLSVSRFLLSDLAALPPAPASGFPFPAPGRDELAEIVYTSGTTAEPRGVMITHGNLLANLEPVEREIRRYRLLAVPFHPLRFLHLIPLSHLFGQVMGLFIPQLLKGVVIFPESQATAELARVMKERRVSVMVSVPQQLEALGDWAQTAAGLSPPTLRAPGGRPSVAIGEGGLLRRWWKHRRLHRALGWKMWAFVVGGAALAPRVEKLWNALGYAVIQGYGLTETAPAITITHPFKIRPGSVGRRLAGAEVRIAEDGEILVSGPNVSPGYYRNQATTQENFAGGWLRTGDLGRLDEEGNLIFLGRKKEVIVTAEGLNVHPADVEQALLGQPGVREAAVVGKEAAGRLLIHAVLAPEPGAGAEQMAAAIAQANQRLEAHQRIRGYSLWPEPSLPRTVSTQKLQRAAIAAWVNRASPYAEAPRGLPSIALAQEGWREFLTRLGVSAERLQPGTRLSEDLGLTSLDRVELLTWLETQGYAVDEQRFTHAATVAQVEEAMAPLRQGSGGQALRSFSAGGAAEPRWPRAAPVAALRELGQWILLFPLLRAYVELQVEGREKLEKLSPPLLFVANHQSILDVPVILRALPARFRRRLAPAMGPENFEGGVRLGELPLARFFFNGYLLTADPSGAQGALRHAGRLAENGYSTLLFPEGRRTPDGRLHPFRPGVGVMVEQLQVPVVPLVIEGLYEIWPAHREGPVAAGRARVSIGDPIFLESGETAAQFTARLEAYYRASV